MGSDQEIRVCHIASGDLWAGAEAQILNLLGHLQQVRLLKVRAVLLNEGELASRLKESGVEVRVVDESKHGFFGILNLIDRQLREKKVELLHSHRYKENCLAALLKRRGVVPRIVQTVHGGVEPFKGLSRLKASFSIALNRYFTRRDFDRVITVSEDIRNRVVQSIPPDDVVAIHNSIDPRGLKPVRSVDEIKAELGIDTGRPVIFTAGRLVPVKGYEILLEAARLVCDRRPEALFVLAGDGPLSEQLEAKSRALGLSDSFLFTGFRSDVVDLINMSDIVVMSSHHEGIPTILLEAMAMGKPVVSTAVGGIPEIIESDDCGILVEADNAQLLASACLDLLSDGERMRRMAKAGRQRIEDEFSSTLQADRTTKLYLELAGH